MKVINNLPFGSKTTVIDNLESEQSNFALSAKQGKVLKDQHEDLKQSIEWGSFTTNSNS